MPRGRPPKSLRDHIRDKSFIPSRHGQLLETEPLVDDRELEQLQRRYRGEPSKLERAAIAREFEAAVAVSAGSEPEMTFAEWEAETVAEWELAHGRRSGRGATWNRRFGLTWRLRHGERPNHDELIDMWWEIDDYELAAPPPGEPDMRERYLRPMIDQPNSSRVYRADFLEPTFFTPTLIGRLVGRYLELHADPAPDPPGWKQFNRARAR